MVVGGEQGSLCLLMFMARPCAAAAYLLIHRTDDGLVKNGFAGVLPERLHNAHQPGHLT